MKELVTKFDLEAAFKELDSLEIPVAEKGITPNRINLKESFNRKLKTDALIEDYYDVNDSEDLEQAQDEREKEVAQAKLARIEKIVDLDAETEEDVLPSYEGKVIIQCPQCMTLFYKNPEDLEVSEDDDSVVNIGEECQHCGNDSGYNIIGKVAAADNLNEENPEEVDTELSDEIPEEEGNEIDNLENETDETGIEEGDEDLSEEEPENAEAEEGNPSTEDALELLDLDNEEEEEENPDKKDNKKQESFRATLTEADDNKNEEPVTKPEEPKVMAAKNPVENKPEVEDEEKAKHFLSANDFTKFAFNPNRANSQDQCITFINNVIDYKLSKIKNNHVRIVLYSLRDLFNYLLSDTLFFKAMQPQKNNNVDDINGLTKWTRLSDFLYTLVVQYKMRANKDIGVNALSAIESSKIFDKKAPDFENWAYLVKLLTKIIRKYPDPMYTIADLDAEGELTKKAEVKESLNEEPNDSLNEDANGISDSAWEELINSKEFRTPISDAEVQSYLKDSLDPAEQPIAEIDSEIELESYIADSLTQPHSEKILESFDDIDTGSTEAIITESLKQVYENVKSFTFTDCSVDSKNQLCIEGIINFKSGKTKPTTYLFEHIIAKDNKVYLIGLNETLSTDNFIRIDCTNNNKQLLAENLSYHYHIDNQVVEGKIKY